MFLLDRPTVFKKSARLARNFFQYVYQLYFIFQTCMLSYERVFCSWICIFVQIVSVGPLQVHFLSLKIYILCHIAPPSPSSKNVDPCKLTFLLSNFKVDIFRHIAPFETTKTKYFNMQYEQRLESLFRENLEPGRAESLFRENRPAAEVPERTTIACIAYSKIHHWSSFTYEMCTMSHRQ